MGTERRCVIIGGGDCSAEILKKNILTDDFIICADSGFDIANECGFTPDLLIGDFDSIKAVPTNVSKITLPVEKDVTDTVAAFNEGVKLGFNKFVLFGGTGGRFEHTLANISLMANASKSGITFEIIDNKHIFRSITNSSIKIKRKDNQQVSVFAFGDRAFGVTLKGFHYPLWDYTLDPFNGALGTSNDIVEDFGEISVLKGTLIIIETEM
ncbi:MAG: thiamine diphosphokinase [Ruminococcaceae bacterium]|nr:thiamine diphosphokinase [Oscillospiraceae bacterium]